MPYISRKVCKHTYTSVMWCAVCREAKFGEREKYKNLSTERLYHPSIHCFAHMTATSKYAICLLQHGETMRWKTQYHSCINNLACVCSACDNAELFIHLSVYKQWMDMKTHKFEHTTIFKLKTKRQGQKLDSRCSESSDVCVLYICVFCVIYVYFSVTLNIYRCWQLSGSSLGPDEL